MSTKLLPNQIERTLEIFKAQGVDPLIAFTSKNFDMGKIEDPSLAAAVGLVALQKSDSESQLPDEVIMNLTQLIVVGMGKGNFAGGILGYVTSLPAPGTMSRILPCLEVVIDEFADNNRPSALRILDNAQNLRQAILDKVDKDKTNIVVDEPITRGFGLKGAVTSALIAAGAITALAPPAAADTVRDTTPTHGNGSNVSAVATKVVGSQQPDIEHGQSGVVGVPAKPQPHSGSATLPNEDKVKLIPQTNVAELSLADALSFTNPSDELGVVYGNEPVPTDTVANDSENNHTDSSSNTAYDQSRSSNTTTSGTGSGNVPEPAKPTQVSSGSTNNGVAEVPPAIPASSQTEIAPTITTPTIPENQSAVQDNQSVPPVTTGATMPQVQPTAQVEAGSPVTTPDAPAKPESIVEKVSLILDNIFNQNRDGQQTSDVVQEQFPSLAAAQNGGADIANAFPAPEAPAKPESIVEKALTFMADIFNQNRDGQQTSDVVQEQFPSLAAAQNGGADIANTSTAPMNGAVGSGTPGILAFTIETAGMSNIINRTTVNGAAPGVVNGVQTPATTSLADALGNVNGNDGENGNGTSSSAGATENPTTPKPHARPEFVDETREQTVSADEMMQTVLEEFGAPKSWAKYSIMYGRKYGISPMLLTAQQKQESSFRASAKNKNTGAFGGAQFMPPTWKEVAKELGFPRSASPSDPRYFIEAQAYYDKQMKHAVQKLLDQGKIEGNVNSLMLAAYNAGFGNVKKYGGVPPFSETNKYIRIINASAKDIKGNYDKLRARHDGEKTYTNDKPTATIRGLAYFSQKDARFAEIKFNPIDADGEVIESGKNIPESGCGLMMGATLKSVAPKGIINIEKMSYDAQREGGRPEGRTDIGWIVDDINENSYVEASLKKFSIDENVKATVLQMITEGLKEGKLYGVSGYEGKAKGEAGITPFTNSGHYLTLTGLDPNDPTQVLLFDSLDDPLELKNSKISWDLNDIVEHIVRHRINANTPIQIIEAVPPAHKSTPAAPAPTQSQKNKEARSNVDPSYKGPINSQGFGLPVAYNSYRNVRMAAKYDGYVRLKKLGYRHTGVDFSVSYVPALAVKEGVVTRAKQSGKDQYIVTIKFANGEGVDYQHLSRTYVKKGDKVLLGQKIGKTGASINSDGTLAVHLHVDYTLIPDENRVVSKTDPDVFDVTNDLLEYIYTPEEAERAYNRQHPKK